MAVVCSVDSHLLPLLETLEDAAISHTEQTDAYLSIANRLSGEEGKDFGVLVGGQFSRLCKAFKAHISNQNSDLSNAALQALGFCLFNNKIASGLSALETEELLTALNRIAVTATDKNTCTRALWVISKQNFPSEEVEKLVPSILSTLESVLNKDVQSLVIEYEALNVVIRLLEQAPTQMTHEAVRWSKLIIPLVVHSAPKVRLRAATSLEIGLPLLLQKQQDVSALTEQLMTSKIVAELQKLFSTKNETYVLKLWPLFVKLLGKTLHRSGSFINSLLQLEELGFRSGSPAVKKIAFIAWKSLIDNFASNPDILCSTKRLKLLMQPLSSIHVRTEALALTKIEVWWYLLMRLGSQLSAHFEQVCLPLLQSALSVESFSTPGTPLRTNNQSMAASTPLQKGSLPFGSPTTPKINLNSSLLTSVSFPSLHLLGIEMLLHFMLGPEVVSFAAQHKIVLSLEPLQHPLVSSSSFFCKHAGTLLTAVQDGFITIGKDASDAVLNAVWKDMIVFTKAAIDTGNKKERQGSEVLTHLLQALKNIVTSDALQVEKTMNLLEYTIKGLPQKVLGSAAYQVANMDLLNGTPALFLIQLHFHTGLLEKSVTGERFFTNFETLVSYALTGPTSPLAFSESVLGELNQIAQFIENKERLWRMWSVLINPLTERINQTNEVNQGDALEHNFRAMHSALMLPITHIFPIPAFPQPTMKTLLRSWSELYKVFARCAALVATAEENVWCEELCSRILVVLEDLSLNLVMLERIVQIVTVIVENFNFSPYTTKFQPKTKTPHTPTDWAKKKREPLGNLNSMLKLLVKLIDSFHGLGLEECQLEANSVTLISTGSSLIGVLSACVSHVTLPSVIRTVFTMITKPLSLLFKKTQSESNKVYNGLNNKLEKLLGDVIVCLGSRFNGPYDSDLLETLSPILCLLFLHKNKQTRNQAAQFWNGSFAKATMLTYPEELKPVLSQVKSKTPLLLPGFTFLSEDLSGPHSENMDNSQLEAKISGIEVRSTGKRDSLLVRVEQAKDKGTPPRPTQAKLKLDFSSPKPKEKLLDEERSVDFVFIPPETKERLLTEHQKEVLRTKRVDIPTMYNNLDASQDTTLFTQYSQSQDNSLEMPTLAGQEEKASEAKENVPKVLLNENGFSKEIKPVAKCDHDISDGKRAQTESTDASAVGETNTEVQNTSNISNSSTSSDMVQGTPPPPVSRRQSFITLEKFDSSMSNSFSPLSNTQFPKATEVLVPDSQEAVKVENSQTSKEKENMELVSSKTEVSKPVSKRGRKPKSLLMPENAVKTEDVKGDSSSEPQNNVGDLERHENKDWVPDSQTQELESEVAETVKESKDNAECKENTPPETINHANNDTSQIQQATSNQKSLRRSSRRQSEILDGVKSIADKGQKPQREKVVKTQEKDGLDHDKKNLPEADLDKVKATAMKQDEEQGESQEITRSRTRYQTRRSSQGLVLASENSESDHSETREESTKRKRSWRSKTKSIEKDDNVNTPSPLSQDNEPTETVPNGENDPEKQSLEENNLESGSEMESEVYHSKTKEISSKTYTLISDSTVSEANVATETNKTYDVTKSYSRLQSLLTEPTASDFSTAVSEVFQPSESNLHVSDCFHKRTKRARRSKSCDCCGKASNNKESTHTVLNSSAKADLKPKKVHSSLVASEMSDTPFDETVFLGPCAVSTPLVETKDKCFFKPSVSELKSDTESEQENTVVPLNEETKSEVEEVTQIFVETKTVAAPEETMESVEKNAEPQEDTIKATKENTEALEETMESVEENAEPREDSIKATKENTEALEETMESLEETIETPVIQAPEEHIKVLEELMEAPGKEVAAFEETMSNPEQNLEASHETMEILERGSAVPKVAQRLPDEISGQTVVQGKDSDIPKICDEDKENYIPQLDNNFIRVLNVTKDMETKTATASENIDPEMGVASAENIAENTLIKPESSHCLSGFIDCSSNPAEPEKETIEDVCVASEKLATPDVPENVAMEDKVTEGRADTDSPPKMKGLVNFTLANDSPGGNSCWSPSASPSTSILKKGVKRQQENDSPSPLNKIRRVSFANPIYQEGLADDIDRKSPVVRCSSSNSPSSRSLKLLTSNQPKHNTTPTKGFVSPSSRVLGFKSSKKNLISEMTKESMPSPKESVYPALMNCTTPVDVILPQITSLAWARGLGQLIRAKNIKTIGDLSTLTPPEIKTLPIRSPKVSTVKKALRVYHEQQTKVKGFDEFAVLDETEKPLSILDEKNTSIEEEKLATDLAELPTGAMDAAPSPDLQSQIAALSLQFSSEGLCKYSASQLFDMQEKLGSMSNCIIRHLQSRWRSPSHENSI
ncbi:replication timing regulatory factor 1 S homeolog isoform X1 [Xenopus laevis]|uniref:replication Timing regulatory factor 1 S homeolog isoform X1 n=2 Tax=Xenopus laevis TaxID=8355 RepID=A0A1L8EP28_XENLA|nr:replication timing regulatory factor 1 S homeolog isoform X1 [Xenopus laevis]XP_018092639.1 replication timing regulatory factor 1 S homeolog isoform X1 [Xenopus laevis]OCT61061.1 hypothetical protein XELAEV_18047090mg [Xenopus laevis]